MRKINLFVIAVLGFVAVTLLLEAFIAHPHVVWPWQGILGFDAAFGFMGCVAIIVLSKLFGSHVVERREDYYGEGDEG